MLDDFNILVDKYYAWLRDKTVLRKLDDWIEISSPFLDRHNDYVQLYARRQNGKIELTDDGYTIRDLRMSGCELESKKRLALLQMTLNGFGVQLQGDNLVVHSTTDSFSAKKHCLLQAMLAVNDLFYVARSWTSSLFLEDLTDWLELHQIRYTESVKFTGKSGLDHYFDFLIPKSQKRTERLIKALSKPTRDKVIPVTFAWSDIKDIRPRESKLYAFLNDVDHAASVEVVEALKNYEVVPVLWTQRDRFAEELAA